MDRAYRFRIYPTPAQEQQIQRTFGCVRFVYNHFLAARKELWENEKKTMSFYDCSKGVAALKGKEELSFLKEVDAHALIYSVRDLDTAYTNFFEGIKKGQKIGYPRFKSKKNRAKSYRTQSVSNGVRIENGRVRLPKIGLVKCRGNQPIEGRIVNATVSQTPSGKYFVSLGCTDVDIAPLPKTDKKIGVDLGIKELAITSEGEKYENHKYTAAAQKKLARLQRQLSRKPKGSHNREKARLKVARLQEHVANQRKDALHKLTTDLIRRYDVVCIEDLDVKRMERKHRYAQSVADASFAELRRQLKYKAAWYGKKIAVIDRFYPSSQLCSSCGAQWDGVKDLTVRSWICPACGTHHDRDLNAAKNILKEGLRQNT